MDERWNHNGNYKILINKWEQHLWHVAKAEFRGKIIALKSICWNKRLKI